MMRFIYKLPVNSLVRKTDSLAQGEQILKNNSNLYQSISCSYYDQLEAYATKRTPCSIVYNEETEKTISGLIVDVYSKEGAEYLKLDNGTVIRLDYLISVNGIPVSLKC